MLRTAPRTQPDAAPVASRGRAIAVAVRDADDDAGVLAWAAFDALAGVDSVHVVHSYLPVHLDDCSWEPVTRAREQLRHAAHRAASMAAQRLRALRPDLPVDASAVGGEPADVLSDLSAVADLVVVGADRPSTPNGIHHVARRLLRRSSCPVVCVPPGVALPPPGAPVTVLADDTGLPADALEFAAGYARRHGVTVQVALAWPALHQDGQPSVTSLAQQQEQLDAELAGWRETHPQVGVSARIELDDGWLPRLAARSGLVVAPAAALVVDDRGADPRWLDCMIAVVPAKSTPR